MPEKIVIAELDLNMEDALRDTIKLKEQIASLKVATENAKATQGELSSEYIQYSTQLKVAQGELKTQEGLLLKVATANNAQVGSLDQMRAELAIVSKQWSMLSKEERENTDHGKALAKQKLDLSDAIRKERVSTGDSTANVGRYTEGIKEATGSLTELIPGLGGASRAATMFGTVLKVALGPIGWVAAAIAALIAYFKRTEEGSNNLTKIIAVFNVVLQNIMDIIGKVGEALFNAITKPRQAWEGFKNFIAGVGEFFKNTFGNVIGGSIEVFVGFLQKAFANVGLAWQKLKGIFVDNSKEINEAQSKIDEYNKKIEDGQNRVKDGAHNLKEGIVNAYNAAKNAITDFIKENQREIELTKKLEDQKAALRKRERQEIINDAKDEREIALLRAQAAEKDKLSGEERLKLLDKAIAIQNAMMEDDLDIARQKASIHAQEMKMHDQNAEALDEQAKLEADVIKIQTDNAEKRRGFAKQRQSAINDMLEDLRKEAEASVNTLQYELEAFKLTNQSKLKDFEETNRIISKEGIQAEEERLKAINQKNEEFLKAQLEFKIKEIDQKENESEAAKNAEKLKLNEDYNLAILQGQTDLNNQIHDLNVQFEEQERQRKIEVLTTDYENELALAENNVFAQLDIQKKQNDLKRAEEIRNAEKTGASIDIINKKYNKADFELEKAKTNAKLSLAAGFASNIATIAGENTKVGKAAAAAAATINTYQAATGAYAALAPIPIVGPFLGIAAAAAAVASGIANVKKIYATNPGSTPSSESSSASSSSAPTLTSSLTSINTDIGQGIVSRSTDTGSNQNEIKVVPTLVVDKVTDAQKSESSKIATATI